MNVPASHRLAGIAGVLAVALSMTLALVARGGESAEVSEYVGAASCATCHAEAYESWRQSTHARALERLAPAERKDARCRQCHTMVPEEQDPALEGVQCEACHGRGRYYSPRWVMRDTDLRQRLYLELGGPQTCLRCHTDASPALRPFNYEEALVRMGHGVRPPAAPDGGSAP